MKIKIPADDSRIKGGFSFVLIFMDQATLSATEKRKYQAYFIAGKFKIPLNTVKAAMKEAGKSNKKIYTVLRKQGYSLKTRFTK